MPKISLDEIISKRQFGAKSFNGGDGLTKIYKSPASWNAEARSARFVMTAEVPDRYGDVVVAKGCDRKDFEKNPVVLWAHNSRAFPIGMWSDLVTINGSPKRIEGTANLSPPETVPEADTVANLVAANMLRACSIGFIPKEWEAIDKQDPWGGYRFNEWELLECSICSVPANPAALVKGAGGDAGLALQAIELVLDEWARTPEGLIVPRQRYEQAYKVQRGADVSIHEVRAVDDDGEGDDKAVLKLDADEFVARIDEAFKANEKSLFQRLADYFGLTPKTEASPDTAENTADGVIREAEEVDRRQEAERKAAEMAAQREAEAQKTYDEEEELTLRAEAQRVLQSSPTAA